MAPAYRSAEHAEESAHVEVLEAQAKRHGELGKKIEATLHKVKDCGKNLEVAVAPVYSDTQELQTINNSW